MGNLWLVIAAPAAVLAAVLYWLTFDIQHADYQVQQAEVRADKAQFDADFSAAWNGKADQALDDKAVVAASRLAKLEKERDERHKKAKAEGQKKADQLNEFFNK